MQADPSFWYTLVVDKLPALDGAIGAGNGQIIIYEGDYLNRALTVADPIVAYSSDLVDPAGGADSYALCLYEAQAFGRGEESSIGELVM